MSLGVFKIYSKLWGPLYEFQTGLKVPELATVQAVPPAEGLKGTYLQQLLTVNETNFSTLLKSVYTHIYTQYIWMYTHLKSF